MKKGILAEYILRETNDKCKADVLQSVNLDQMNNEDRNKTKPNPQGDVLFKIKQELRRLRYRK